MGLDTDFAGLCARVDELEHSAVAVAAGQRHLTEQLAAVVVEQAAAREHRLRQEARMQDIEHRIDRLAEGMLAVADAQATIVERLDGIGARLESSAAVTDDIAAALRWVDRTRRVIMWIGAPLLGLASIYAAVKMMMTGHAPPPPPPPPGGPY